MTVYPGELSARMQIVESGSADFTNDTWTFKCCGAYSVGSGPYLLISKADWDRFWEERGAFPPQATV